MNPGQQMQRLGIAASRSGTDRVLIQVGRERVFLTARQAQTFAYELAHAYYTAGHMIRQTGGTPRLAKRDQPTDTA